MRKVILLVTVLVFTSVCVNSQTGWFQQTSTTQLNLYSVYFIDDLTGYAVGGPLFGSSGIVLKTTNSGNVWFNVPNTSNGVLWGLHFVNSNTGFVVGYNGNIRKTTNGGITWITQIILDPLAGWFKCVYFLNENTGYIGGISVFYTSNGGTNWERRSPGVHEATYLGLKFFNKDTGIVVGENFGTAKTTNGGINWTLISSSGLNCVSFADVNNGIAAGYEIKKTTNQGNNWIVQYTSNNLRGASYMDINNAIVVGSSGKILRTLNGGTNWIQQLSGTTKMLHSVSFVNINTGWSVGDTGIILKTTTGGLTPITPVSNKVPSEFKLHQNYPNPFNPITKIRFAIPKVGTVPRTVRLIIYDMLGREITTPVNEQLNPGTYEVNWDASNYPSSVYFYKLVVGDASALLSTGNTNNGVGYTETKKMVLIK